MRIPEGRKAYLLFMLDSGSTIHVIKIGAIGPELQLNPHNALKIGGITPESVQTLGTVKVTICGRPYTFHVVPDNFILAEDGILG